MIDKLIITFEGGKLPTVETICGDIHTKKSVSMAGLLNTMVAEAELPPMMVEDNLVATNASSVNIYFIPPHKRDLLIDDLYVENVPLPGLILGLKYENQRVSNVLLFSVQELVRNEIDQNTKLFRAPFPNTYDHGGICWGSASVSQYAGADWRGVLSEFFESRFNNHIASGASKSHPDDVRELLISLTNKNIFPVVDMMPSKQCSTLGKLLERMINDG